VAPRRIAPPLFALVSLAAAGAGCGDAKLYPLRRDNPGGSLHCPTGMVGYATMEGGTTGGGSATPVTVTTRDEFAAHAQSETPEVIQVNGLITLTDKLRLKSNKTIVGVGAGSGFTGGGLDLTDASNVILRNLIISKASGGTERDAITILRSRHVWVDHCDLSSELVGGEYDGLVDITHASDWITVSWTALHDHRDTSLIGHSEDNATEDTGHLTVTFHHNLLVRLRSGLRIRFGTLHAFNNQFQDIVDEKGFGIASESNAQTLVEQNNFESVFVPITTQYKDKLAGTAWEVTNRYFQSGENALAPTTMPRPTPPYPYTADQIDSVSVLVSQCAGVGTIDPLAVWTGPSQAPGDAGGTQRSPSRR
jgi:pectate lyase